MRITNATPQSKEVNRPNQQSDESNMCVLRVYDFPEE